MVRNNDSPIKKRWGGPAYFMKITNSFQIISLLLTIMVLGACTTVSPQATLNDPLLRLAEERFFPQVLEAEGQQQRIIAGYETLSAMGNAMTTGMSRMIPAATSRVNRDEVKKAYLGALREIALGHSALGNNILATYYFSMVAQIAPEDPMAIYDLAVELWAIGQDEDAGSLFMKALEVNPHNSYLLRALGHYYWVTGDTDRAIERFLEALSAAQEPEDKVYAAVALSIAEQRSPSSVRFGDKISVSFAGWPSPILNFLRNDSDINALVAAINDGDERTARTRLCEALYYVGESRLAQGKKDQARAFFESAINTRVPSFRENGLALRALKSIEATMVKP